MLHRTIPATVGILFLLLPTLEKTAHSESTKIPPSVRREGAPRAAILKSSETHSEAGTSSKPPHLPSKGTDNAGFNRLAALFAEGSVEKEQFRSIFPPQSRYAHVAMRCSADVRKALAGQNEIGLKAVENAKKPFLMQMSLVLGGTSATGVPYSPSVLRSNRILFDQNPEVEKIDAAKRNEYEGLGDVWWSDAVPLAPSEIESQKKGLFIYAPINMDGGSHVVVNGDRLVVCGTVAPTIFGGPLMGGDSSYDLPYCCESIKVTGVSADKTEEEAAAKALREARVKYETAPQPSKTDLAKLSVHGFDGIDVLCRLASDPLRVLHKKVFVDVVRGDVKMGLGLRAQGDILNGKLEVVGEPLKYQNWMFPLKAKNSKSWTTQGQPYRFREKDYQAQMDVKLGDAGEPLLHWTVSDGSVRAEWFCSPKAK